MAEFCNFSNKQEPNIEAYVLVDTLTGGTTYTGTASSFPNENAPTWKIKKQYLDGTVCRMGFPDSNQCFSFVWSCRCSYTYH